MAATTECKESSAQFTFSGEIVEVGDGCVTFMHEGLLLSVPCNETGERWGRENLRKEVEVQVSVRLEVKDLVLRCLTQVRDLISDPARWVQNAGYNYAVDTNGNSCRPRSEVAVRWELLGAVDKLSNGDNGLDADVCDALQVVLDKDRSADWLAVSEWHGHASHEAVLKLVDDTIAHLQSKES